MKALNAKRPIKLFKWAIRQMLACFIFLASTCFYGGYLGVNAITILMTCYMSVVCIYISFCYNSYGC